MTDQLTILQGDSVEMLKTLPGESVQCCVTSPPYWGLRSYLPSDHALKHLEIGSENTPQAYVDKIVSVFSEVKRVLASDGTLWLNLGDSYAGSGKGENPADSGNYKQSTNRGSDEFVKSKRMKRGAGRYGGGNSPTSGDLKSKDLVGIPWMVAFALRADGWYLRSDIIWAKKNCMPESVTDRPTRSHEHIFLLSKSPKYYYDHEAIKEPGVWDVDGIGTAARKARSSKHLKSHPNGINAGIRPDKQRGHSRRHAGFNDAWDSLPVKEQCSGMRNKRDVWSTATARYLEAHFATFPADLIIPCIRAGSRHGDVVLDPFGGSGTVGEVALSEGRRAILCELNPDYIPLIRRRCNVTPGLHLTT